MADVTEASAPDTSADSSSIADHEAAFMMGGEEPSPKPVEKPVAKADAEPRSEEPPASRDRDERGKFKPRPAVAAPAKVETPPADTVESLTERLRTLEAENTSLKAAKPAVTTPPATAREPEPAVERPTATAETFPSFEAWAALKGNEAKTFEDFIDERTDYRYEQRRQVERADEAARAAVMQHQVLVKAYSDQLPAVLKKYPDFQTVMNADPERVKVSKVVERAVLEVGPEIAYYLVTHDEDRKALSEESLVDPENPAFPAAVAAMKRYLKTLIAVEALPPEPRAVARPTLVPRPPTPTKTGGMPPSDEAPEDDASIASHEAYFGPKSGRR